MIHRFVLMFTLLLLPIMGQCINTYEKNEDERYIGWYWKNPVIEEEKEEEETTEERKQLPPLPPESELMSMHPKDIEKMQEEYLDQAVWQPTPQNVANYVIMKDVMRRKSKAFTAVHSMVVQMQPELNAMKNYPANNRGRQDYMETRNSEIDEFLISKKDEYAYILLTTDNCKRCENQKQILGFMQNSIPWRIEEINITNRPEVALRFNITYTPTLIMISPFSDNHMPITAGIETHDRIKANTYRSIHLLEGTMKPEQFFMLENERGSSMDPLRDVNKTFQDYFNDM